MVRAVKSTTSEQSAVAPKQRASKSKAEKVAVIETVVAPVEVASPVKEKKTRVSKTKAVAPALAPVSETPVAAPAVQEADAAAAPVAEEHTAAENALQATIKKNGADIQTVFNMIVTIKNNQKLIEKQHERELKNAQKSQNKRKRRMSTSGAPKTPSTFTIETTISNEIAQFVGVEPGTKMSRTNINSKIHEYIVKNNLRDEKDKRVIYPDAKLSALLHISPDTKLEYFNIQKYLSGHFATRTRAPLYP